MHTKQNFKNGFGIKARFLILTVFMFLLISCVIPFFFGTYSFGSSAVENNAVYGAAREFTSYDEQLPQEAIDFLNAPLSPEEQAIVDEKANNNSNQSNEEKVTVTVRPIVYDEESGQYYQSVDGIVQVWDLSDRSKGEAIDPVKIERFGGGKNIIGVETAKDQRLVLGTVIEPLKPSEESPWDIPIIAYFYFDIADTHQDIYKDLVATCSTLQPTPKVEDELGALAFVNIPGVFFNNKIGIDWKGVKPQNPGFFINIVNPTLAGSRGQQARFTVNDKLSDDPYSIFWKYRVNSSLDEYLGRLPEIDIKLTPKYNPAEYEFVGWFRYREDDSAIGQKHLVQCYTGDTFSDWSNLKAGYSTLSDWLLKPLNTQLRYYLMANFRPINYFENYNVRIKVADKDKDKGIFVGSNGDEPANLQDYTLKLWSDSSKDQYVHFGSKTIGDCSDYLEFDTYDSAYLQDLWYPYYVEDPFVPYMFKPQANEGYVFAGWTAFDDWGNWVDINNIDTADKLACVLNRNVTFYANFKPENEISGTITDKDSGQPIENALVSFTDYENNSYSAITNESGQYSLGVKSPYGTITASSNGYQSANSAVFYAGNLDLALDKIDYCVYLSGDVYKLRAKDHQENPGDYIEHYVLSDYFDFSPYYAVAVNDYKISFTTADGYYSYYQNEVPDEPVEDDTGHYSLAVPFGSSGVLTIEKDGFQCFRCYLNSFDTSFVGVGGSVNVANLSKEVYNYDGKFLNEWWADWWFKYSPMTILQPAKSSNEFSCILATENSYFGSISVDGVDASNEAISFPADTFYHLNLANGNITIDNSLVPDTENSETLYAISPVDNKENNFVFYKWVQYTKEGAKTDLFSNGKVLPGSVIFAEFKEGAYMNLTSEDPGHASYSFNFENTTSSIDGSGAVSWQASTYNLKQYNLASFSIVEDEIVCMHAGIQDWNNWFPYNETTTINAIPKQGFVLDHWVIDGNPVSDGYKGNIETGKNVSVQAVYRPIDSPIPPEPGPTPDPDNPDVPGGGGSAQTGDTSPIAPITVAAVIAALCCVASRRKNYLC